MRLVIRSFKPLPVIVALLPILLMSAWIIWGLCLWLIARSIAIQEFYHSRGNTTIPLDSREFATRGVRAGADEREVDNCMEGSKFCTQLTRTLDGSGFVKYYSFSYGVFRFPLLGCQTDIIREDFVVYFDEKYRASAIERHLVVKGGLYPFPGEGHTRWQLMIADSTP